MSSSIKFEPMLVSAAIVGGYALAGSTGAIVPLAAYGLYKVIGECNRPQEKQRDSSEKSSASPSVPLPLRTSSSSSSSSASSLSSSASSSSSVLPSPKSKQENQAIYIDNGKVMRAGRYEAPSGARIEIEMPMESDTVVIDPDFNGRISDYDRIKQKGGTASYPLASVNNTGIEVWNQDCLDATLKLKKEGYNPILLNMANQTQMGGGYKTGARAQEEDICRRTTLYGALGTTKERKGSLGSKSVMRFRYGSDYNIPEFGCIASRKVQVLRDNNYRLLENPEFIDLISSAAYNLGDPKIKKAAESDLKKYESKVKRKIRNILKTAILSGHDAIVLSAFGCGAFRNKPDVMARLFGEVLDEKITDIPALRGKSYKEAIKVVFAIIEDRNDTRGNFQAFKRRFP